MCILKIYINGNMYHHYIKINVNWWSISLIHLYIYCNTHLLLFGQHVVLDRESSGWIYQHFVSLSRQWNPHSSVLAPPPEVSGPPL